MEIIDCPEGGCMNRFPLPMGYLLCVDNLSSEQDPCSAHLNILAHASVQLMAACTGTIGITVDPGHIC